MSFQDQNKFIIFYAPKIALAVFCSAVTVKKKSFGQGISLTNQQKKIIMFIKEGFLIRPDIFNGS